MLSLVPEEELYLASGHDCTRFCES